MGTSTKPKSSLQDRIQNIPVGDLIPDPKNARQHGERNLGIIAGSLERYGQRKPIVVQRKGKGAKAKLIVRAGNGTLQAAKSLDWKTIACAVFEETDQMASAYGLADNRAGEFATWDDDLLRDVLDELPAELQEAVGFSEEELTAFRDGVDLDLDLESDGDSTGGGAEGEQFRQSKGYEIAIVIPDEETLTKARSVFMDLAQKLQLKIAVRRLGK